MSNADVLLNIATAARLFHASDGTGFVDLLIDGEQETWPKRFQAWLLPRSTQPSMCLMIGPH